jgi:hypothetical protein
VIIAWTLTLWIRDARAEYVGLPVHHDHGDDHHAEADHAAEPLEAATDEADAADPAA